jgi:hypothetical protein
VTLEVTGLAPEGDQPSSEDQAAAKPLDNSILAPTADIQALCTLYLVLLLGRNDKFVRKPYLSLHSAQAALQRAQERGQECHLVLCRVEPLSADLEPGGEWSA